MKISVKRTGMILTITMMVLGISVYAYYFTYGRTAMALDVCQAKEYLWRARACGDLKENRRECSTVGKPPHGVGRSTGACADAEELGFRERILRFSPTVFQPRHGKEAGGAILEPKISNQVISLTAFKVH